MYVDCCRVNINQKYSLLELKAAAGREAQKNPGDVHGSFRRSCLVLVCLFLNVCTLVGAKL